MTIDFHNTNESNIMWWGTDYTNMDVDDGRIFYCPTIHTVPPYYFQVRLHAHAHAHAHARTHAHTHTRTHAHAAP
jgi:hypothetical protein